MLQEITSPADQPLLLETTSGDGVVVFVNGEEQLIHLNPSQKGSIHDVVLVRLKKGKNQLLVKFFNNFQKNITASFYPGEQQVFYRKTLEPVNFQGGKLYSVMMSLTNPVTPHQDMLVPNLSVEFVLK